MNGPISNPEQVIYKDRLIDVAPISDFEIMSRCTDFDLGDTLQFRGYHCTIYSITYYARPYCNKMLLRRDRHVVEEFKP